ncbi:MAG: hypothetical protein IJV70_01765 [Clostridia bacterium]|nr:hypothetical protein [Clostridia bacterium]
MNAQRLSKVLTSVGIVFEDKLSASETRRIEELYGFRFPNSLKGFYREGVPCSEGEEFPRWHDFSKENVEKIKARMNAPLAWLKRDIENCFWIEKWGERPEDTAELAERIKEILALSPMLIPIYSHRYMPAISEIDAPIISTVGRDTIYYGNSLEDYLKHEFLGESSSAGEIEIPLWSDIIEQGAREFAEYEKARRRLESKKL